MVNDEVDSGKNDPDYGMIDISEFEGQKETNKLNKSSKFYVPSMKFEDVRAKESINMSLEAATIEDQAEYMAMYDKQLAEMRAQLIRLMNNDSANKRRMAAIEGTLKATKTELVNLRVDKVSEAVDNLKTMMESYNRLSRTIDANINGGLYQIVKKSGTAEAFPEAFKLLTQVQNELVKSIALTEFIVDNLKSIEKDVREATL